MLTALLDALINFIGVLVGWLVDVAVVLEATPFSFAWPLLLALLLQVLLAAVNGVVWWARGTVWPINCGYPETTTGRGPCHNDVLGEWSRCRIHRRRGWFRRTDSHVIVDLRRWQTIDQEGRVVSPRSHLQPARTRPRWRPLGTVQSTRPRNQGAAATPIPS